MLILSDPANFCGISFCASEWIIFQQIFTGSSVFVNKTSYFCQTVYSFGSLPPFCVFYCRSFCVFDFSTGTLLIFTFFMNKTLYILMLQSVCSITCCNVPAPWRRPLLPPPPRIKSTAPQRSFFTGQSP